MPIKRKPTTKKPSDAPRTSPADPSSNMQGSLIWTVTTLLRNIFSHKGTFWLGFVVALTSYVCNSLFYITLLLERGNLVGWQAIGLGLLISTGTTLFEIVPVAWSIGYQNRLQQIFHEAAKPTNLPSLHPKYTNADDLLERYRNADRETREFFNSMRYLAIAVEIFIGVLFLGAIGSGMRAAIALCLFVASIFGCEWGVSMALRSANWELPPAIRKQFDELIRNADRPLSLGRSE